MTDLAELLALYRRERGGTMAETVHGVQDLSAMFNGITPRRPGYLAAGNLRRAYVNYYLPVNAEKVRRVLAEMDAYAAFAAPPRVLDFGCGPGTASVALLMANKPVGELCLVDVVDEALDDAEFFVRRLGAAPRRAGEPPAGKYDLILAANVFSETEARLEDLLTDEGYLVVVEPALKEATRRLMEWRDRKVAEGYRIAAPCLGEPSCPMLEHEDLWCHMDVPWDRSSWIAEVDRRAGLLKESLKFSYMVLTKRGRALADLPGDVRLVSNLHREKGKAWAWACGRRGPLCRVEVLTRHRSEGTADFFHASRGDVLEMDASGESTRSEGPIRKVR